MSMSRVNEAQERATLMALWRAALSAAEIPGRFTPFLPPVPPGRTVVVGAGKGAAAMAREFDAVWPGSLSGAVVTRHGYGLPDYSGRIEVFEAGHPVPDAQSVEAAERITALLHDLGQDDLVVALISGGASALLVGLPPGVTLEDKQAVTRQLLSCGASIGEINTVRKHMSTVKGGQLAQMVGAARVVTLAVSDIPGDDIAAVGSGPTIADSTTITEARAILNKHAIVLPGSIERYLRTSKDESRPARPRPTDEAHLVVTPAGSLEAAAKLAEVKGYEAVILGDDLEDEARELGAEHAQRALSLLNEGRRTCLLSGGETTVTIRGKGRGGRNSEYLLGLTIALDGRSGVSAVAADTDGIDGSEDNAGAFTFASTLPRATERGLDAQAYLDQNDSYHFFAELGDLLITGPTYTNVNDFRAILIDPSAENGK